MTEDEFWSATEELKRIYQWARARYAAPWAVLGAVLLRVSATTEPSVQLPGVIGGPASLNLLAAFVAPSGGGKGISDKVARAAWPADIVERPIGSGEGIAALFQKPKNEDAEHITRAILSVPEIDTLTGMAKRQGNILLAQLKSVAMGELIGQSNASEATTRIVQAHAYRCCLSVGAQPGHAGVLFDDTTGGTPQRFLWFPTTDPDMPAVATTDPEPLNTALPSWARTGNQVLIQYGHGEITEQIIGAHLARQRGGGDALDGHWMLTRCKVAAALAVMGHRSVVTEQDWRLSAVIMAKSDATRDWMIEQARAAERTKIRDRAVARATGDDFYDASRLETVKNSLLRMLERDGEQSAGDLRRRLGKREKRELFDQAIGLLEAASLAYSAPGEKGSVRYGPGSRVTTTVTLQNPSSERVTRPVTGDQLAIDNRLRSPSSAPTEGHPTAEEAPLPRPTDESTKPARPTTCTVCYVTLPAAATRPLCDDCDGAPVPEPPAQKPPERPLHVVHNGASRDYGSQSHKPGAEVTV